MDTLIVFLGYLLVTSGAFILYLIFFRRNHLPLIFNKWWFLGLIIVIAILAFGFGWLLATRIITW